MFASVSPAVIESPLVDSPAPRPRPAVAPVAFAAGEESPPEDRFVEARGFVGPTRPALEQSPSRYRPEFDVRGLEEDGTHIELEIEPKLVNILDPLGAEGR